MINFQNIYLSKITLSVIKKLFIILFSFDKNLIYSLYKDIAAGTEHLKFFSHIKELEVIVDIGAHIGYYSLYSSKKVKNGRVFAFEPFEESFEILIKNLELNQITNVVTQNMGVSHKSGSATLYLKKDFSMS